MFIKAVKRSHTLMFGLILKSPSHRLYWVVRNSGKDAKWPIELSTVVTKYSTKSIINTFQHFQNISRNFAKSLTHSSPDSWSS